jgi:class 3 adenylate cyclase
MDLRALAQRIRDAREKRRLKQSDVAHAVQVSAQAVSKWERAENAPDLSVLLDLAKVLGVTTDWLLGRAEVNRDTFEATVFCTSLNRFAERAARLPPREVAARANGVFHLLTEAVLRFEGVPVKYVGDGFLAFFSGTRHAQRAVQAALHARELAASPDLVIMLHAGEIYLGAIGHADYARPDIMGQTVNTAFLAMQWAAGNAPEGVSLTESVASRLEGAARLSPPRKVRIKGLKQPLRLYVPLSSPAS